MLRPQFQYLGHVLSNGKCFPYPSKTQGLREWETRHITTAKALKGFPGLGNWYSMHICNCANFVAPLMEPLKAMYQSEDVQGGPERDGNKLIRKTRKRVKLNPKQAEIKGTAGMEWSFQQMKEFLIDKVDLYLPRPDARSGRLRLRSGRGVITGTG